MAKMWGLFLIFSGFCCIGTIAAVDLSACLPNRPKVINTIFNSKGSIYSPGYDEGTYPNDIHCSYTIRAPRNFRIKLTFKHFDVDPFDQCDKDRLEVHEGDNPYTPVHGVFCGNYTPNAILSTGNALHLVFASDFLAGKKGFHLEYEAAIGHLLCEVGKILCRNRNCYTAGQRCNGEDECGDGTDEEDCGEPPTTVQDCGVPPITPKTSYSGQDRVVGGEEAIPGSWPWQADLQLSFFEINGHNCGGTLINSLWVVSAAHCFGGNYMTYEWRIHLGKHRKFQRDKYEQVRYPERIIVYPGYTGDKLHGQVDMENDVALMKLNAPVKFTDYVHPACFPKQGQEVKAGTICMATGWGMTKGTGKSDVLKQVEQVIKQGKDCETDGPAFNNKTMICVAGGKGFEDTCQGDSGGPLVCKFGQAWNVMGANSFGTQDNYEIGLCGTPGVHGVFSKLSDKTNWVNRIMNMYS